jgi:LmbE family N-acetylglucosaminyl deacetylase
MAAPSAIAIAAHPDDIEFYMAGTLLLLRRAGYQTHYFNLAGGNCGSTEHDGSTTRRLRRREANAAAAVLGAHFHPSLTADLEIQYNPDMVRRIAAVIREVRPVIVLTHSPQDYMEDHTNTARLAVTAAFARGMPNFQTNPRRRAVTGDLALYHAMPHGLRDPLRRRVVPGAFVNTTAVHSTKLKALAQHQSQQNWLEASQGLNSYLATMEQISREVGSMSRRFKHAEGWRRHLHLGFSANEIDPLRDALGREFLINKTYEKNLEKGR